MQMLRGSPTHSHCRFPCAPPPKPVHHLRDDSLPRQPARAFSSPRRHMSFVGNDDNLSCPICEVIYPTANSVFVLSSSDEGSLSQHFDCGGFELCSNLDCCASFICSSDRLQRCCSCAWRDVSKRKGGMSRCARLQGAHVLRLRPQGAHLRILALVT